MVYTKQPRYLNKELCRAPAVFTLQYNIWKESAGCLVAQYFRKECIRPLAHWRTPIEQSIYLKEAECVNTESAEK